MSTTTTNYGLIKPELTDVADITKLNANWDKIDEALSNKELSSEGVLVSVPIYGWTNSKPYTISIPVEGVVKGVEPIFYLESAGDVATEEELASVRLITDIHTNTNAVIIEVSEIPSTGFTIALYGLSNDVEFSPSDYAGLAGRVSANEVAIAEQNGKIDNMPYIIEGSTTVSVSSNGIVSDSIIVSLKPGYRVGLVNLYGIGGGGIIQLMGVDSNSFSYYIWNRSTGSDTFNVSWRVIAVYG